MKSVIKYLFSIIMMILLAGYNVEATTPCSKGLFRAICNPKLKLVEQCYECHRLDNGKEKSNVHNGKLTVAATELFKCFFTPSEV